MFSCCPAAYHCHLPKNRRRRHDLVVTAQAQVHQQQHELAALVGTFPHLGCRAVGGASGCPLMLAAAMGCHAEPNASSLW